MEQRFEIVKHGGILVSRWALDLAEKRDEQGNGKFCSQSEMEATE